jgi:hypothetical protein
LAPSTRGLPQAGEPSRPNRGASRHLTHTHQRVDWKPVSRLEFGSGAVARFLLPGANVLGDVLPLIV